MNCTTAIIDRYFVICDGRFITTRANNLEMIFALLVLTLFLFAEARTRR